MAFKNYKETFEVRGKRIFVPNDEANRRGEVLLRFIERRVRLPDNFFHYQRGGHVAAIHSHLTQKYFFKVDLQRYYYSVGRNRVAAALHSFDFKKARDYAKWSCVKNPYVGPRYSLPIGFVQSPALATLVLMRSPIFQAIEESVGAGVVTSVYLDDIVCSGDDLDVLTEAYRRLLDSAARANFTAHKNVEPSTEIRAFNCDMRFGYAAVTADRLAQFYGRVHSTTSVEGFVSYCEKVASENI
jgi:hypothetical protein